MPQTLTSLPDLASSRLTQLIHVGSPPRCYYSQIEPLTTVFTSVNTRTVLTFPHHLANFVIVSRRSSKFIITNTHKISTRTAKNQFTYEDKALCFRPGWKSHCRYEDYILRFPVGARQAKLKVKYRLAKELVFRFHFASHSWE